MSNIGALFSGQDNGIVQSAEVPLFSEKHIPQYRSQHLPTYQLLPTCESFNKLLLPAGNTHAGHTQHGQEKIPIV